MKKTMIKNLAISLIIFAIMTYMIYIAKIQIIADYKVLINVSISMVRLCINDVYGMVESFLK